MPTTITAIPRLASLAEWLEVLANRHPREIELGLERVAQVADRLDLARPALAVVTVAGTNGKGSCVAAMEALLLAAGRRVGSYTSPHLIHYNERIRINGMPASDRQICAAFVRIEEARSDVSLTYFEFGTLAALLLMAEARVDVALLEVGLGGRLDAVNLIDADVAVITSIQLDHEAWLGSTRDAIGLEKAGIARPGVPVVCGDPDPPPAMVDYLALLGAPTRYLGDGGFSFCVDHRDRDAGFQLSCWSKGGDSLTLAGLPVPQLPCPSIACAVQAMLALGEVVTGAMLSSVLRELTLGGRFQRISFADRALILDVAHNPAAAELLAANLARQFPNSKIIAVFAALADKDIDGMVDPLSGLIEHWYVGNLAGVPRAAEAAMVEALLYNRAVRVSRFERIEEAFAAAIADIGRDDTLLVFGSFYTVSAILKYCRGEGEVRA